MLPTFTKAESQLTSSDSLASAFVGVGRIAPDEERLVILKPEV